jgi:hypothetical protein
LYAIIVEKESDFMERNKFTTYLDIDLIERLKILAVKKKCSAADILNQILREFLEGLEKADE